MQIEFTAAEIYRREAALKAMIEQMKMPEHDEEWCGTNDCCRCEFLSIAQDFGWPLWAIPHKFEGPDLICDNCGYDHGYELHI